MVVSVAGLIMIWRKGDAGDPTQDISIGIQAIYIILFAVLTIRYARGRQFAKHRIWALRLFLVVNGVWFFRVGLMFWLVVNGGPVGFDPDTFTGPFLTTSRPIHLRHSAFADCVGVVLMLAQRKQNIGTSACVFRPSFFCVPLLWELGFLVPRWACGFP